MIKVPTEKEIADICDIAIHCGDADMQISNKYGIEGDELDELLLNKNIERCTACNWFRLSWDFINDDEEQKEWCSDCRNDSSSPI